jgi:hypothetical protein
VSISIIKESKMNMAEVKKMAKRMGIRVYGKKKAAIIHDIQKKEGNFPCFGTAGDYCDQLSCLWRSDCLK